MDVLWVLLHAGMNTGPVRAGCAYTRPSDWVVSARWVRSCGSSAAGLANEVLYNTRWPLYGAPSLSDTLGQGLRFSTGPPEKEILRVSLYGGYSPVENSSETRAERARIVVQTYRRKDV